MRPIVTKGNKGTDDASLNSRKKLYVYVFIYLQIRLPEISILEEKRKHTMAMFCTIM